MLDKCSGNEFLFEKTQMPGNRSEERFALVTRPEQFILARRELHQLDRVEVLDAAAGAFGGVKQHIGLCGIRGAQHARP